MPRRYGTVGLVGSTNAARSVTRSPKFSSPPETAAVWQISPRLVMIAVFISSSAIIARQMCPSLA